MLPFARRRSRFGCGLGCLTRTLLVCVLAGAAVLGAEWIFTPGVFYFGGTFHPLGQWQGTAHVKTSAGDFVLTVWLQPARGGHSGPHFPDFSGGGFLCSPTGDVFRLRAYAVIPENTGRDTDGKPMRIDFHQRPLWTFFSSSDPRPRLALRGRWRNPDLVMDDGGTLSRMFLPDGHLYDGPESRQPQARETVPVVFHESPWTFGAPACAPAR